MRGFTRIFMSALALSALSSCHTSPVVENFPRRYIDRPYALPMGMASFETSLESSFPVRTGESEAAGGTEYFLGMQWRQALSDNYTLLWSPLPLGLQYQAFRSSDEVAGASWSVGFDDQFAQWALVPRFEGFHLKKIDAKMAMETRLDYFWTLYLGDAYSTWTGDLTIGPVYQVTDLFAISPRIGVTYSNFVLRKIIESDTKDKYPPAYLTFPFGLRAQLAGGHLWELAAQYTLGGIRLYSTSWTHNARISYTYYW